MDKLNNRNTPTQKQINIDMRYAVASKAPQTSPNLSASTRILDWLSGRRGSIQAHLLLVMVANPSMCVSANIPEVLQKRGSPNNTRLCKSLYDLTNDSPVIEFLTINRKYQHTSSLILYKFELIRSTLPRNKMNHGRFHGINRYTYHYICLSMVQADT